MISYCPFSIFLKNGPVYSSSYFHKTKKDRSLLFFIIDNQCVSESGSQTVSQSGSELGLGVSRSQRRSRSRSRGVGERFKPIVDLIDTIFE